MTIRLADRSGRAMRHDRDAVATGAIGPNAVTRIAQALTDEIGAARCRDLFGRAGLSHHIEQPPQAMVDDEDVARLHAVLHAALGAGQAARIGHAAGILTGDYLLAHRIPAMAQTVLPWLPKRVALRILVGAIARHAWTFAGRGRFAWQSGAELLLTLKGAPVARHVRHDCPVCTYYAASFARVFGAMLGPATRVTELTCEACGDAACTFRVSF